MWEKFFVAYNTVKGKSTNASTLGTLIGCLRSYPVPGASGYGGGSTRGIAQIEAELGKVKKASRLIGKNPAIKYALAIAALEEEIQTEKQRLGTVRGPAGAAAVSARVKAHGSGAIGGDPAIAPEGQYMNNPANAKNVAYWKDQLEKYKPDLERRAEMETAFATMLREPKFGKYYLDEMGWTNVRAWLTWGLRAATPEMISGPAARDAMEFLRELSRLCIISGHQYAESYLLELSIYCSHEADRADISFVVGQATSLVGTLCGPILTAALGSGVLGTAAKGAKALASIGVSAGAKAAGADSDGDSRNIVMTEGTVTAVNVMRFTHAWLRYVTEERTLSTAAAAVASEFGGRQKCAALYEKLMEM